MFRITFCMFFLLSFAYADAQVEITPVFKGESDSVFLKNLSWVYIDSTGTDYSISYSYKSLKVLNRNGHLDTFRYSDSRYIPGNEEIRIYSNRENHHQYYMSNNSSKLWGPIDGYILTYAVSKDERNIALSVLIDSTVSLYINDILIRKIKSPESEEYHKNGDNGYYKWCTFSDTGKSLYAVALGTMRYLYAGGKLIDTTSLHFHILGINNSGKYVYAKVDEESGDNHHNSYQICTSDTTLPPVTSFSNWWYRQATENPLNHFFLGNDGNYFIADIATEKKDSTGFTNYQNYSIVNNAIYKSEIKHRLFDGNGNYLFFYTDSSKTHNNNFILNHNGKTQQTKYDRIYHPIMNNMGKYAYCGQRNYYLYKNLNGKEQPQPITGKGVRAYPYSISLDGSVMYALETEDSIYIYNNERFLHQSALSRYGVCGLYSTAAGMRIDSKERYTTNLYGLYLGDSLYQVRDGVSFNPINIKDEKYSDGYASGNNFFMLQVDKQGNRTLYINSIKRATLEKTDIDTQRYYYSLEKRKYFTNTELIFYKVRDNKVCRYKTKI